MVNFTLPVKRKMKKKRLDVSLPIVPALKRSVLSAIMKKMTGVEDEASKKDSERV